MMKFSTAIKMARLAAKPDNPPSGADALYTKTDGGLYLLNSLGIERPLLQADEAFHTNPSWETGTIDNGAKTAGDGWSTYWSGSTVWSFDTTTAIDGARSLKAVAPSGSAADIYTSAVFAVQPGSVLEFSTWAKTSVTGNLTLRFLTAPPSGTPNYFGAGLVDQPSVKTVTAGEGMGWGRYASQFTVPAGHTQGRFFIIGQQGRTWWFDASGSRVVSPAPVADDTGWITPTLSNGWATISATPQYRRMNGVTFLRGTMNGGTAQSLAFTLPVGYRPGGGGLRVANWGSASGHLSGIFINTSGGVQPYWLTSGGSEISLDSINFPADA